MNRRSMLAIVVISLAFLSTGCFNAWIVLSQATPDPFINQGKFGLLPIDYKSLHIGQKTEADYLAGKDADQQRSFMGDKQGIDEAFAKALIESTHDDGIEIVLASGPGDAPFMIQPIITFVEPGFYAYITSKPSEIEMTLRLTTPDGRVLDEIALKHSTPATMSNPSSGGRWRDDGKGLGKTVARYLRTRVHP
jgi:hypothetical protein